MEPHLTGTSSINIYDHFDHQSGHSYRRGGSIDGGFHEVCPLVKWLYMFLSAILVNSANEEVRPFSKDNATSNENAKSR